MNLVEDAIYPLNLGDEAAGLSMEQTISTRSPLKKARLAGQCLLVDHPL